MDIVLERGIVKSFPEECLQKIVRREFLKSNQCEGQLKVDTLAILAIKSIMHKKMMMDETDIYSQFIYKLIFKEPLGDMEDFREDPKWCRTTTSTQHPDESNGLDSRKGQIGRLRSDGPIMFSTMSQEPYYDHIEIIVNRLTLQICVDGPCIAEIPHRDGSEYDTYWAEKFTKLILSKYANFVILEMDGEELPADQFNEDYMLNFLNESIIDKIPRVIPPEGWEQYISEERPVYMRHSSSFRNTNYSVFFIATDIYSEFNEEMYWSI